MKIEGIRYKYESGNLYGIIYRKKDNQEIAFLQFDEEKLCEHGNQNLEVILYTIS